MPLLLVSQDFVIAGTEWSKCFKINVVSVRKKVLRCDKKKCVRTACNKKNSLLCLWPYFLHVLIFLIGTSEMFVFAYLNVTFHSTNTIKLLILFFCPEI